MSTLASVIIRDLFANRPAAGSAGRLFFATDTGATYRDSGTAWESYSGTGAVTSVAGRTGAVVLASSDISGLAASATTDTTNAANISSGTLNAARLPNFVGDTGSGGTKGAVPAPAAGDAAAGKFLKADGTFAVPAGSATGTVTSVSIAATPSWLTGTVATATSTPAITLAATSGLTANQVLATPNGSAGALAPRALVAADLPTSAQSGVVGFTIDGGGSVPPTGSKGFVQCPYAGTVTGWTVIADQSGSAQITVKKATYSGFPTTSSIVASAVPALSSAQKATSTTLTGWTTSVSADDIFEFNLDSVSTCTRLVIKLQIIKA